MASSSSPQNPQPQPQLPPTSSTSPSPQLHPHLPTSKPPSTPSPRIQDPSQGLVYPLASSGRGFIPKTFRPQVQPTDQLVTPANPGGGGYPPPPPPPPHAIQFSNQVRNFGVQSNSAMRPPPPGSQQFAPRFIAGGPIKGRPGFKASPYQSPATGNGYRDLRDTNRDDIIVVCNRKVRLSDGASLYALCRSWVRNGLPKEIQPHIGEGLKLLPRPLPIDVANTHIPEKSGSDDEDEEKEEDGRAVEDLSARELLLSHVKRAKKVRSRLRKDRLQRIERYKQRLALLLPSAGEQFRNDTAPEN